MNTTGKITKLVSTYARVSTEKQEDEKTIENQLMEVRDFAEKNSYTIIEEYRDDGWSGDILARPGMDRLRENAKKKKWEAVIVYDPDRIARRYSYQELIMDELKELNIEVIFITVPSPKNSEEKILHGVRGLFAEYERAKITERFRLGKLRKAKEGHVVASEAPYGYDYVLKKDGKHGYYKINEKESEAVKMMFNWIANEKLTLREVVKRLHELGIKPRESERGVWSTSTLSTLFKRTTYIGKSHYLKSYAVLPERPIKNEVYKRIRKTSRKIRPKEDWIEIPTPAILDNETFERARQVLNDNFSSCIRNTRHEYLLAGKVYCTCGRRRTGESIQRGKHLYYRCTDRVHSYPLPRKCHEASINAKIADSLIWDKIKKIMSSPKMISREADKWMEKEEKRSDTPVVPIGHLKKRIEKLKKEEERYITAYGAEAISLDQLKEQTAKIREEAMSLKKQMAHLEQEERRPGDISLPPEERLKSFCQEAKRMINCLSFSAKQEIIRELIEKITGNKKEILVEGYLPINKDYYVEYKSIGRHYWFS